MGCKNLFIKIKEERTSKPFDHGLQKPFYKNKRRENFQTFWLNEGLRPLTNYSLHHCIWGRSPPFTQNLLDKNLWIIGIKTFG